MFVTHEINCHDAQRQATEGWMKLSQAARLVGVSNRAEKVESYQCEKREFPRRVAEPCLETARLIHLQAHKVFVGFPVANQGGFSAIHHHLCGLRLVQEI